MSIFNPLSFSAAAAADKHPTSSYSINKNIFIYSRDRDWSRSETKTFDYKIAFGAETSNSNASIVKVFRNIKSISIDNFICPDYYCNLMDLHGAKSQELIKFATNTAHPANHIVKFERLSDLPFINMRIAEIGNTQYGTNDKLNSSIATFIIDTDKYISNDNSGTISYISGDPIKVYETGNYGRSLIPGNACKTVVYRNLTDKKIFFPSVKGILTGLDITFYKPSGEEITLMNDTLTIKSCEYYNTAACVAATTADIGSVSYSGLATASANTTVTLAIGSSATNDFYNNLTVTITGGTGIGQPRTITDYVGSTRVATVATWTTNPDTTSTYSISNKYTGIVAAISATTITLATGASDVDDLYNDLTITITGGTGIGQSRIITDYVGSTLVATVATWTTTPDTNSTYEIVMSAKLEAPENELLSIDDVAIASTNRVLVKDQADAKENGIYTLTTVGASDARWVLTRATLALHNKVLVSGGTKNANKTFALTNSTTFVTGTDDLYFLNQTGLKLVVNEYFSPEEYKVGDTIILKNIAYATNTNGKLQQFLERAKGHVIIALEDTATSPVLNQTFFNAIVVGLDYSIVEATGAINIDTFDLTDSIIPTFTAGTILNLNNQHLIKMSIETEHYNEDFKTRLL
jgi:hypothetical protein